MAEKTASQSLDPSPPSNYGALPVSLAPQPNLAPPHPPAWPPYHQHQHQHHHDQVPRTAQASPHSPHRKAPAHQLRRLLVVSLARWVLTALLGAAIYGILWHYSSRHAMTAGTRRVFNALIIGFSIGLGLNIASSLKHMAREVRWWVLSLHEWSVQEAGLVLQADDLSHVAKLTWVSSNFSVRGYAAIWLLINAAFQIGVATLGLTYSVGSAHATTLTKPGPVAIANMTCMETAKVIPSNTQSLRALRYTANSHGTIALAFLWGDLADEPRPGTLWDNDDPQIFCGTHSCRYYFYETTPEPRKSFLAVTTDRSVDVTGDCQAWRVRRGGDGLEGTITIDDGRDSIVGIPARNGPDQTIFMVNTTAQQQPWSVISAFEASLTNPWFYRCNISFGAVLNAHRLEHRLGLNVTSLASASIALQGYGATASGSVEASQFQSYPAESWYGEAQNGSAAGMGLLTARFTAGVLAVTAMANSDIIVPGLQPVKAVTLQVAHWKYVHVILGLTLGLQLGLAVLIAVVADRVCVQDDGHYTMSLLLRPLLARVDESAIGGSGGQIAAQFRRDETVRYVKSPSGACHVRLSTRHEKARQ